MTEIVYRAIKIPSLAYRFNLSIFVFIKFLCSRIYFGRCMSRVPEGSLVFLPCHEAMFCCGLAGIVSYKYKTATTEPIHVAMLDELLNKIENRGFNVSKNNDSELFKNYLGGERIVISLLEAVQALKGDTHFFTIFGDLKLQETLEHQSVRLTEIIDRETRQLSEHMGLLGSAEVDAMSQRIDSLKDIAWCLSSEILQNVKKVRSLLYLTEEPPGYSTVNTFKKINAVLNSLDRLEVRGRDSAGVSLMFVLKNDEFERFKDSLEKDDRSNGNLLEDLNTRCEQVALVNRGITTHSLEDERGGQQTAINLTYKVAAEIGRLGDNVDFLRHEIQNDPILQKLAPIAADYHTISAHTRWASVGAINEPNCHPVDNRILANTDRDSGIIHACLNGDIDNFIELKREFERHGDRIHENITTDTKIIPLQIQKYIHLGHDVAEAFRLAVNDFQGSHAISMHTDLAPGRLFLAQKGSGQALFIGLAEDHYMPTSEVYGFVEETPRYLKMDGEKIFEGPNGNTQGQIFILSQDTGGGIEGIRAMTYDGSPVDLDASDIKQTKITSRDIDRQEFPHYFLKEISESPDSVAKTLQNRWKIKDTENKLYAISLNETTFPQSLQTALVENQIKRIFFIGQGTAGVAAQACADILNYYLDDPSLQTNALKASELSGFKLGGNDQPGSMADVLVIAISQSGTTTDTNRTVDMVKERGAHTLAIVNRRDSDITFKVDGTFYTSSGRDIEMSVASTKAFYSQIVAGALLSLKIAHLKGRRNDQFVTNEIRKLLELPDCMRKILTLQNKIEASARRLAVTKTYWAAVGSGPNKASADEIRIKLSELCYKTISSDFVEDKKHIDLSSEPLIIVCTAGTRGTVIGDIIKDTAIFCAHKATPVVIADEGEDRFKPYAEDVFHVPVVSQHLAPIVNTLVGHIWGYYAALAINEGSRFLYLFREDIQNTIDAYAAEDLDIYEVILEKSFREKIAFFYKEFRRKKAQNRLPTIMGLEAASDLTLLLKYLSGRLPASDFELDFGTKGTASSMLKTLFNCLGESINYMARPIDAIKHQAKTVTVGTSRIREKLEGILFEILAAQHFSVSQLTNSNIIVLKNLQGIVSQIEGSILYKIGGLNLLGEPTDDTTIEVVDKQGVLEPLASRVETDTRLKGTKRIIVGQGNVYIGKGRKDDRSIIVIPIISASPAAPNMIEYLLLLNISFKTDVSLPVKIKALGGKYEHIKNIVQENSIVWDDQDLDLVEIEELFGRSAEKIGEFIVSRLK
jgi:glucosamine--fructose-6-phosphate aminotransferase (isomerizing)